MALMRNIVMMLMSCRRNWTSNLRLSFMCSSTAFGQGASDSRSAFFPHRHLGCFWILHTTNFLGELSPSSAFFFLFHFGRKLGRGNFRPGKTFTRDSTHMQPYLSKYWKKYISFRNFFGSILQKLKCLFFHFPIAMDPGGCLR